MESIGFGGYFISLKLRDTVVHDVFHGQNINCLIVLIILQSQILK